MNSEGLPIQTGRVNLSSTAGVAVYADTIPAPTQDDNGRKGWLYTKTGGAEKLNYYFYSEGSTAITLATLENAFFVGIVNNWTNTSNVPFIVVYTKMKGDGQDAGSWYRTRRAFSIFPNEPITIGMRTQFQMFDNSTPTFPFQKVTLANQIVTGPNQIDEEILTISVQTDSGAVAGSSVLISNVGWKARGGHNTANPNVFLSSN